MKSKLELAVKMTVPLKATNEGVIRVGETRVRLDTVVHAFNEGYTAEEIVSQYSSLVLSDVYVVLAHYLENRLAVDKYITERTANAMEIQDTIESKPQYQAFREQLLKRRATLMKEKMSYGPTDSNS